MKTSAGSVHQISLRLALGMATLATATIALGDQPSMDFGSTLESGTQRVNLIELYSSEGCSSCPPADQWFSSLRKSKEDFVYTEQYLLTA